MFSFKYLYVSCKRKLFLQENNVKKILSKFDRVVRFQNSSFKGFFNDDFFFTTKALCYVTKNKLSLFFWKQNCIYLLEEKKSGCSLKTALEKKNLKGKWK